MNQQITLTSAQKDALREILRWLARNPQQPFVLAGYAGTGKSTLMAILRKLLARKKTSWKVAFTSFTGKASQVLAQKLQQQQAVFDQDRISTLHSFLYEPIMQNGQITSWIRKDKFDYQLLVIDEASMVNEDIWQDVRQTGLPVLAVGDHGQLPPINSNFSLMDRPNFVLESIHRQAAASKIHEVAWLARSNGEIPVKKFSSKVQKFNIQSSEAQVLIDDFFQTYQNDTLFLTGFNRSRVGINNSIRAASWRNPERPEPGDKVVCLKNDWEMGVFNGLIGYIKTIEVAVQKKNEILSYQVEITDDQDNLLYRGLIAAQQFNQEKTLNFSLEEQRQIGQLFDYGYALTVHKAQGSQALKAVVIEERSQHMSESDWQRWLYTAVTRAEEELYIFGKPVD